MKSPRRLCISERDPEPGHIDLRRSDVQELLRLPEWPPLLHVEVIRLKTASDYSSTPRKLFGGLKISRSGSLVCLGDDTSVKCQLAFILEAELEAGRRRDELYQKQPLPSDSHMADLKDIAFMRAELEVQKLQRKSSLLTEI